ncbi:integrase core domain-containing protein [Streptomyces sp. NPDC054933]
MPTVIEQASRRIRILGATAHPKTAWVAEAARNLVMDLEDAGCRVRFLIRDLGGKYPQMFDAILTDAGIETVLTGVRMPRMNAVMERWVATCRRELLNRTPIWNQRHLINALSDFEHHYNTQRPHRALGQGSPLRARPAPINDPDRIAQLNTRRHGRLGGTLHEYRHTA